MVGARWLAGAVTAAVTAGGTTVGTVAEQRFASGPARVALVELYTSEGCGSCPPAQRWLGELRGAAGLWRDFAPVAWHADYWNRLGWPDRFSMKELTRRHYAVSRRRGAAGRLTRRASCATARNGGCVGRRRRTAREDSRRGNRWWLRSPAEAGAQTIPRPIRRGAI
ncbi:MAG: DUF1223 domain-containing protein [Undibacterium sp.]|nr:DUF1223 domain-containing protein [Opitutaceae bacterium]